MNASATSLDRHKRITLLFLKHASLRHSPPDERAARLLAEDVSDLGGPYIRAANLLSVRGDLLPGTVMAAFSNLAVSRLRADEQEAEPMETIDKVLEDEIGKKALRAFATFHPEPYRFSGAGQVHRATLHDGRQVCVRVQRPNARRHIVRDLDTLAEIASFIDHPSGRGEQHRFSRFVDRFRITTLRELDYRREEAALEELREKLNGCSRLRVPRPVAEFCSGRVLTTEFIDGSEIWEISPRSSNESKDLVEQFLTGYLDQLLVHGLVHPAPDLENLLLNDEGELIITEAGGCTKISSSARSLFGFLLHGICTRDAEGTAEAALRLGRPAGEHAPDTASLAAALGDAIASGSLKERLLSVARVSAAAGRPFPMEISRIAEMFGNLSVNVEAIHPHHDTERFISSHIRGQMRTIRENTVSFHSTSAA